MFCLSSFLTVDMYNLHCGLPTFIGVTTQFGENAENLISEESSA